ncbi:hypothetical protein RDWZM_009644 [Blomia tropicalis]|uniref:Cytochrome c oxidase assembly factor 6 homolog n=1 Tax=Blomia tropicalis TaxID=40697 RepID=A0A9Q0M5N5_BLOTA|nr:hypothetical protein RDWZM_009644 [Blomia tropicalis]
MSFPKKEQRTKCYSARDEYWNCLDQNQDKNEKEADQVCSKFRNLFEQQCPAQWVSHFSRKYKYLKFKEKMDAGFDPVLDDPSKNKKST